MGKKLNKHIEKRKEQYEKYHNVKNIALVGNPNCGKTLIFNNLTGGHQHVGNWTGVTVEKKIGHMKGDHSIFYIDLPGIYSLSPYTSEEIVTRKYLVEENPRLVLDVVDASNLERNLYLTTQILETGRDTIVILNMMDVAEANGIKIYIKKLSKILGVPVVPSVATKKEDTHKTLDMALGLAGIDHISIHKGKNTAKRKSIFCGDCDGCDKNDFISCKKIEIEKENELNTQALMDIFSKDTEKVLEKIADILKEYCSEKRIRYYSVKILEKDKLAVLELNLKQEDEIKLRHIIAEFEEARNEDSSEIITAERYDFVETIIDEVISKKPEKKENLTEKIDSVLTNKWLAFPIFIGIMFTIYFIAINTIGGYLTGLVNDYVFGDFVPKFITAGLEAISVPNWVNGLVVDGIIAGVGGVLGFVPQIMVLFFLLSFLEDSGYMWGKGKMFIKKAGTIILVACILIWFLSNFNFSLHMVPADNSILAHIGKSIAVIFQPLGFGDWRAVAASITGLIAKENLVGTMGVLYSNIAEASENGTEIWGTLRVAYTPLAGFSLLIFNLLCMPCFAAVGAIYREMNSLRWTLMSVGYQCFYAYAVAFVIYQLGLFFTGFNTFNILTAVAFAVILWAIFLVFRKPSKSDLGFGIHRH